MDGNYVYFIRIQAMISLFLWVGVRYSPIHAQKETGKNLPKTEIRVNKEVDKDGNIIRYDSVYTYTYSDVDTLHHFFGFPDSMFFFDRDTPLHDEFMENFPFTHHFFNEDSFGEMDSIFHHFGLKNMPGPHFWENDFFGDSLFNRGDFGFDFPEKMKEIMKHHQEMFEKYYNSYPFDNDTVPQNFKENNKLRQEIPRRPPVKI